MKRLVAPGQILEPGIDPGLGVYADWDVPLLDGYPWVQIPNRSPRPGSDGLFDDFNPGCIDSCARAALPLSWDCRLRPRYFLNLRRYARSSGDVLLLSTDGTNSRDRYRMIVTA